jgi:hypothetical protein
MTCIEDNRFLTIEHDGGQREEAQVKRVYSIDLRETDANGVLEKTLVADLMNLNDPGKISGVNPFTFPFTSVESVIVLDDKRIGVLNDNNFPFGSGRTANQPEDTEFIIVSLDRAIR